MESRHLLRRSTIVLTGLALFALFLVVREYREAFCGSANPFVQSLFYCASRHAPPLVETCGDREFVVFLQSRQARRAQQELHLPLDQVAIAEQDLARFYQSNFGYVSVEVPPNPSHLTQLLYYRIWKNANDYIRHLLYRFASQFGEELAPDHSCEGDLCIDPDLHFIPPASTRAKFHSPRSVHVPFTFVRDPLARFISGYTEIEYRVAALGHGPVLQLDAPLGSQPRVQQFITGLLTSRFQGDLSSGRAATIKHVAPMIGSLLVSRQKDRAPMRLYRIEQFETEWDRLAKDLKLPALAQVQRDLPPSAFPAHNSSRDPFNTTRAAFSYLAHASDRLFVSFFREDIEAPDCLDPVFCYKGTRLPRSQAGAGGTLASFADHRANARAHLRAICRLYLIDYQCTGYALPEECSDLQEEFEQDKLEFYRKRHAERVAAIEINHLTLLRLLPETISYPIAEFYCLWTASPPQCIAEMLYNENFDQDEEEDMPVDLDPNSPHSEL